MTAFSASKAPARRVEPSHRPWEPWSYQTRGVAHLMGHAAAALFLDPGLGKTAITLAAFLALKERGHAERMLVVAPLRVCQLVWRQEGSKWTEFRELRFSLLHGPKKAERLRDDADVYLVNPEGIPWLIQQHFGRGLPWDTVVLDELTKFKNHRAVRSKKLRKALKNVQRRWGLTGSPAPNGYMDLFGQMMMLDDGAALGRHITHYRDTYFQSSFTGFDYELRRGSAEKIEERIAPYVLRMAAADYLDLPPVRNNIIRIELAKDVYARYKELERDMVLSLPEGIVTGSNSGAVYSKLAQMANGAVYISGGDGEYAEVHGAKLDALEDLIEELSGQPLLVGYEFQHDLARIRKRLGADTPTLSGLSEKKITELEAAWNRGEVPVLLAHPASVAHGLNLQGCAAAHVCWFGIPWDLELFDQFLRRILRQGTEAEHITLHILQVLGTIDELKCEALESKDLTQQGLLRRLNAEILRDDPAFTATARAVAQNNEDTMTVRKLGFRNPADNAQTVPAGDVVRPRGWGAPATTETVEDLPATPAVQQSARRAPAAQEEPVRPKGWGPPAGLAPDPQREAIREKISAPAPLPADDDSPADDDEVPASVRALHSFPSGIVQALEDNEESESAEVPQQYTAATTDEPKQPRGWTAPAAHAPGETEEVVQQAEAEPPARRTRRKKSAAAAAAAAPEDRGVGSAGGNREEADAELHAAVRNGSISDANAAARLAFAAKQTIAAESTGCYTEEMEKENTYRHAEKWAESGTDDLSDQPYVRIRIEVQGLDRAALGVLFASLATCFVED